MIDPAEVMEEHETYRVPYLNDGCCYECAEPWPCEAYQLAAALQQAQAAHIDVAKQFRKERKRRKAAEKGLMEADTEIGEQAKRVVELGAALREIVYVDRGYGWYCRECGMNRDGSHADGCRLEAAIAGHTDSEGQVHDRP